MKALLLGLMMLLCGAILAVSLMKISLERAIVLPKDEWRCIEYQPGSAECAVYERVNL